MSEQKVAPVALVPYWTYLIPIVIAIISAVQAIALTYMGLNLNAAKTEVIEAVAKTDASIVVMERQINSNMERQIRQAIGEALAQERLRVSEGKRG